MKIEGFNYRKKDGEQRTVDLLLLQEDESHIAGIDFTKLSEDEKNKVVAIQQQYEDDLKPFMKAYRKFLKDGILNEDKK